MKNHLLKYMAILLLVPMILSGCSTSDGGIRPAEKAGTVVLSVNPSVEVTYDANGLVMDITGLNEDGLDIASEEDDLIGLPCLVALHTIIKDIYDAGFFVSDFGGEGREIILQLKEGSIYHKGFLEALEKSVYESAEACGLKAITLTTINENIEDAELTEDLQLHQLYLPDNETME